MTHVTDGEAAQWGVVGEGLDTHGLAGHHLDNGGITGLDELGGILNRLASATVDLLKQLGELASNVGSVAVEDWSVSSADLARVVQHDDLSVERLSPLRRVALGVTGDVATTNLLDGDVLDIEADIVSWQSLDELLVVHLDGLHFGGDTSGSESDDHAGLKSKKG